MKDLQVGVTLQHDRTHETILLLTLPDGFHGSLLADVANAVVNVAHYGSDKPPVRMAVRALIGWHTVVLSAPPPCPDTLPEWLHAGDERSADQRH